LNDADRIMLEDKFRHSPGNYLEQLFDQLIPLLLRDMRFAAQAFPDLL